VAITCGDVLVDSCERTIAAGQVVHETRAIPVGNMWEPLDGNRLVVIIGADFYTRKYRERLGKSPFSWLTIPFTRALRWESGKTLSCGVLSCTRRPSVSR
jgi:hypothetical protein